MSTGDDTHRFELSSCIERKYRLPLSISDFKQTHPFSSSQNQKMRYLLAIIFSFVVCFATAQNENTAASATPAAAPAAAPAAPATPTAAKPKARKSTGNATRRVSSSYTGKRVRSKGRGYRVQIYSGAGNTASKEAAQEMAAKVRKQFPELSVYCRFKTPRWVCRVGDFSTKEAAQRYLEKIRRAHLSNEASIVIDDVLLPR